MYFKVSMRTNPATGKYSGYYRLVESYRNRDNRICHRTILNCGYLDNLIPEQLNQIQKILTAKALNNNSHLFESPSSDDAVVLAHAEEYYNRMIAEKRIDVEPKTAKSVRPQRISDIQRIDINSIKNKDVREIGTEWLSMQALTQLKIADFLKTRQWSDDDIKLAQTHIIARAAYPASELETTRWIDENSAVCEVTGYDIAKITKDKLYRIAHRLYAEKDGLEQHLSVRTNELFDIEDTIMLYDLTNTYFEGRKTDSTLARFGRSKEKRGDAKLVVLALVVNPEGFIKYSSVLQGNIADSKTLAGMIDKLRIKTSVNGKKALVVIDAGIATDENVKIIHTKGYDYMCVSRSSLKNYKAEAGAETVTVRDNKKQIIKLCRVTADCETDYYIKVESQAKELKERSMNEQFRERFEAGLQTISDSLSKKGGTKTETGVYERIGRIKQKYPSIARYFDISVHLKTVVPASKNNTKRTTKKELPKIVSALTWKIKEGVDINERSGVYFLRTSLNGQSEETLWKCYNTIREIESTFRTLKSDLDLRPIYHKNDDSTMAHLHLGLLAYWVVNTIRYQLKAGGIHSDWREIVRTMNTQKAVTTTAQNEHDQIISIRKCSEINENVKKIYDTLKYKYAPFVRKKSVVHKPESEKNQNPENQFFMSG